MLILLSPAKALSFAPAPVDVPITAPAFAADTAILARTARRLSSGDLRRLMGLSEALGELTHTRFQAFDPKAPGDLQAVFAFNGDVYRGLGARDLDAAAVGWAQDRIRILSGLYGLLRPLDAIQPYRLEMGSRLATARGDSLYAFWGGKLARAVNAAAAGHADPTVINLASQEYFGAIDTGALKRPLVTCHFRQSRGEGIRALSFLAKRARGLMSRWAIDNRVERAGDLRAFDTEAYAFRSDLSGERDWVFVRPS